MDGTLNRSTGELRTFFWMIGNFYQLLLEMVPPLNVKENVLIRVEISSL